MMLRKLFLVLIGVIVISSTISAQNEEAGDLFSDENDLMNLSLEELMNLEVKVGNISGSSNKDLPLSVTTITKEQIELSPSYDLLHLIQMYVPGATYWRRSEGALLGFRGIISDRNTKLLITINGLVVNQKAHGGVITELENWDLDDIERIDIIRGPGSVTYGPGAIAGVINITTKAAGSQKGFKVSANYVTEYNSKGFKASYGFEKGKLKGFFHGSVTRTEGIVPDGKRLICDSKHNKYLIGSVGDTTGVSNAEYAASYMKDYEDQPQIKLYGTVDFGNNTFTARYNKTGSTVGSYHLAQEQQVIGFKEETGDKIYGDPKDAGQAKQQQLILSLKNKHQFKFADLSLESEVAFIGGDYQRARTGFNDYSKDDFEKLNTIKPVNSIDHPLNLRQNFSENSWVAKTMGLYKISDKYKIAAGVEFVSTKYGKGWGDDARSFRMGENYEFVNGPDSWALYHKGSYNAIDTTSNKKDNLIEGEDYFFIGDGWRTSDIGFVAEANLQFAPLFNLVLSGRLDKNTYSDWLFSPRVGVISKLDDKNTLRFVLQRSQRVSNAEELYKANKFGLPNRSEKIDNLELIYSSLLNDHMMLNLSGYYSKQNALGKERESREIAEIADVEIAGFDIEYRIQYHNFRAGLSHAFVKCLDYKYKGTGKNSVISFADQYNTVGGERINVGSGTNLTNIANNNTQLYADRHFNILNKKTTLHTELSILWDYEGNKDAQAVAAKSALEQKKAQNAYDIYQRAFDDYGFFGPSYFWNASITSEVFYNAKLTLGVNNILGNESAKIYHIWQVTSANYFVEPRTFTARFTYKF